MDTYEPRQIFAKFLPVHVCIATAKRECAKIANTALLNLTVDIQDSQSCVETYNLKSAKQVKNSNKIISLLRITFSS